MNSELPHNISVFNVKKNLTRDNTNEIRTLFSAHIDKRKPAAVVFDLDQVRAVDSAGLRLLLSFIEILRKARLRLALSSVSDHVSMTIRTAGLHHFLTITTDVEEAVELLHHRISSEPN